MLVLVANRREDTARWYLADSGQLTSLSREPKEPEKVFTQLNSLGAGHARFAGL